MSDSLSIKDFVIETINSINQGCVESNVPCKIGDRIQFDIEVHSNLNVATEDTNSKDIQRIKFEVYIYNKY